MNPAKTAAQVNAESQEGKDLYKVTHHDFEVGKESDALKLENDRK